MEKRQLAQITKKKKKKIKMEFDINTSPRNIKETKHRQILMQQSNNSTYNQALNIRPFLDFKYCMQDTEMSKTISCYSAIRNTPISDKEYYLFLEQYKTLKPEQWIDGTIINCFVVSHINRWKNKYCVYTNRSHNLYIG